MGSSKQEITKQMGFSCTKAFNRWIWDPGIDMQILNHLQPEFPRYVWDLGIQFQLLEDKQFLAGRTVMFPNFVHTKSLRSFALLEIINNETLLKKEKG